jgi:hypothetical protein
MSIAVFASKSGRDRRRDITRAADGKGLVIQRMTPGKLVVNWGEAPNHVHSPCPNAANNERFRAHAGVHLVFNAFWKIQHFCVHQMLMRDPMHQVDLGALVTMISASHQGDSAQVSRKCRDSMGQGQPRCKTL